EAHVEQIVGLLNSLPRIGPPAPAAEQAPVLIVPRIFEPELCRTLIRYYDERGGAESGFMREVAGKTVPVMDHAFNRRRDQEILREGLRNACTVRIGDRLAPAG